MDYVATIIWAYAAYLLELFILPSAWFGRPQEAAMWWCILALPSYIIEIYWL